jgi:pullulanase/glycogen debranching enzyme
LNQLVAALHQRGIGVIMDVVHSFSDGGPAPCATSRAGAVC